MLVLGSRGMGGFKRAFYSMVGGAVAAGALHWGGRCSGRSAVPACEATCYDIGAACGLSSTPWPAGPPLLQVGLGSVSDYVTKNAKCNVVRAGRRGTGWRIPHVGCRI